MTDDWRVVVHQRGSVVLDGTVVCDGFMPSCGVRVQSHAHSDHMTEFNASLGIGDVVCLQGTRDLIVADEWPLGEHSNFRALEEGVPFPVKESDDLGNEVVCGELTLFGSNHMLGSAQSVFVNQDGIRTGYSGDFGWPIEPIEVDQIVIDGTSSPTAIRDYTQEEAEDCFVNLVHESLFEKSVVVSADLESMYRAIRALSQLSDIPVLIDKRGARYAAVYEEYGVEIPTIFERTDSRIGKEIANTEKCVFIRTKGGTFNYEKGKILISLIPFYNRPHQPIFESRPGISWQVGMTNHADFLETLLYVEQCGASHILVDNARGKNAAALVEAFRDRFGNRKVSCEIKVCDGTYGGT